MKFDCLDRKTNIWGMHFLEASAGTGKTFAIEHIFCRFLLEKPEEVSVDEVLIVTFTRAATRELRIRIHKAIYNLLSDLDRQETRWDYFKPFLDTPEKTRRILLNASRGFEDVQIFTIHGFCHRMLTEYAFEAGLKDFSSSEEYGYNQFIEKRVGEYLQLDLDPLHISYVQIHLLLKKFKGISGLIQALTSRVFSVSKKAPRIESFWKKIHTILEPLQGLSIEKLKQDFDYLVPFYKQTGFSISQVEKGFHQVISWLSKENIDFASFENFLENFESFPRFFSSQNQKKREKFVEEKLYYSKEFFSLVYQIREVLEKALDVETILNGLLYEMKDKLKKDCLDFNIYPPDLLLEKMNEKIKKGDFKSRVQGRFQIAIIDEFQDTDQIQWEIFQKLFLSQSIKAFYLVGDPKQSIYSFRSADLYTYFEAARKLGEEHHYFLDTNFRSVPCMICNLNLLFSKPQCSDWLHLPKRNETYPYHSVQAGREQASLVCDEKGSVHFFLIEAEKKSRRWPSQEVESNFLFPYVSNEILHLRSQGVLFSEVTILVKDRYQAQTIQEYLKSFSIPATLSSRLPIGTTKAFFALRELFSAIYNPTDISTIRIVLAGPFIQMNLFDLQDLKEEWISKFYYLKEVLQLEGLSSFFSEFLETCWKEDESVEETLIQNEDRKLYSETLQIIELLLEEQHSRCFSKEHLYSLLDELKHAKTEDSERIKIRSDSVENSVQILTTHASKGLEFPYVFSLGTVSRNTNETVDKELRAEKLRLLYVAFTRAKNRLYIPLLFNIQEREVIENPSASEIFTAHFFGQVDLSCIYSYAREEMVRCLNSFQKISSITYKLVQTINPEVNSELYQESDIVSFTPVQPFSLPERKILSFTQLSHPLKSTHVFQLKEEHTIHSIPAGSETGIIFHKILEEIFLYKIVENSELTKLINKNLRFTALEPWTKVIEEKIQLLMKTPLQDGIILKDLNFSSLQTEVEFYRRYDKDRLHGFIDFLFMYKGKYYLIDWKSNWLGESHSAYTNDKLQEAMQNHDYFLQAKIYKDALRDHLSSSKEESFNEVFGGMLYVFLRGIDEPENHGVFSVFK